MQLIKNIWKILKHVLFNKYIIVFGVFAVYVTFFDSHNLIDRWERNKKLNELQQEYKYYQNEIKDNNKKLNALKSNDEYLEKFAREKYLMKKANEDIFIIK
jgi:cell division protein FtsB